MKKLFYSFFVLATTAMTFMSCEDVPMPYDDPSEEPEDPTVVVDPAGSGTADDPYNIAAINQIAAELEVGETSTETYYFKGIISSVKEEYSTQFGNGTFYISDDGTASNQFYVYRALYLNNAKFKEGDTQVKAGDEVVVCGKLTNYNGTLETEQNGSYLYSLNGEGGGGGGSATGEATGSGTETDPYNATAANAAASALSESESLSNIYVKGKVSSVEISTEWGNATYNISDDGTTSSDQFIVYRGAYLGGEKFTSEDQLKVGDEVIVLGNLINYKGNTPEMAQGSKIVSLNGETAGGGETGEGTGSGTLEDPYNAVKAAEVANALGDGEISEEDVYIKGKISNIKNQFDANYGTAIFSISDDGSTTNQFLIYSTYYLGNRAWVEGDKEVKLGDEVIICGKLTNYKGTPETASKKSYIYSLNGETADGGEGGDTESTVTKAVDGTTVTLTDGALTASEETVTVDLNAQGWEDKATPTTVTLNDGTTIVFSAGENPTNAPKFYAAAKGVRCYAKNDITITGVKAIAKVVMTCDSYNNVDYVGNDMLYGENTDKVFKIVNDYTQASGGVQLRVQTITITYAK